MGENGGCFLELVPSKQFKNHTVISVLHTSVTSTFSGLDDGSALTVDNDSSQDDEWSRNKEGNRANVITCLTYVCNKSAIGMAWPTQYWRFKYAWRTTILHCISNSSLVLWNLEANYWTF